MDLRETYDPTTPTQSHPLPPPVSPIADTPDSGEFIDSVPSSDHQKANEEAAAMATRRRRVEKMNKQQGRSDKSQGLERERVKLLTDKILTLKPNQFVAEHSRRSPRSDDSHRLLLRREIRRRRELPTSSRGFRVAQPPPLALSQRAHGSGHSRRSGPVESRISRGGDFR
ncbi:hypothetical protein F2Q70_00023145 [Brassica cretica]|uniref:Uncharacterized protein n=2 Tax=Brassica cretica TaxID=69181 RepID=A0A8S9GJ65_BRACR|nr:hypothetical protein F2Q70_00023145 [Brassica cretica]KAF2559253.1 hypothetical protein F2Q68_00017422 [Brassica cretica]KAF3606806.1 hypothetical protein DY000_02050164 [Brassica cretica]